MICPPRHTPTRVRLSPPAHSARSAKVGAPHVRSCNSRSVPRVPVAREWECKSMLASAVDDILKQAVREKGAMRVTSVDGTPASHNARALQVSEKSGSEGLWIHLPETDEATVGRFAKSLPNLGFSLAS